MAVRVETGQSLKIKNTEDPPTRRYLFFIPPELWIGKDFFENHKSILKASNHQSEEVVVAGFISKRYDDKLLIDGNGSSHLEIGAADPTPVLTFVKSLRGINPNNVIIS